VRDRDCYSPALAQSKANALNERWHCVPSPATELATVRGLGAFLAIGTPSAPLLEKNATCAATHCRLIRRRRNMVLTGTFAIVPIPRGDAFWGT
jgi:hypothetical protein